MYREIKGNLFAAKAGWAFAHCVSQDGAMGAGIALQFRHRYPRMPHYVKKNATHFPSVVRYVENGRVIYNLVTKARYYNKPSRHNFAIAVELLFAELAKHGETKIAMPLIGAGLDQLPWAITRNQLQKLSKKYGLEVVVVYLKNKPW
jgi:O-acetyl-ADP-ribose deacetylase (regulator of RNase III)